jgi:hypothetical protein
LAIHHQHLFAYFDEVTIGLIILSPLTAMHCLHFVSFLVHPPAFSAWVHPLLAIHHQYIFESFDEYRIGLPLLSPLDSMLCAFLPFCASPYLLLVIGQIRKTSSQNCQSTKPKPKDA